MIFFSPMMTAVVIGLAALIVVWLIAWLPAYRRKTNAVEAAESEKGAFLAQTLFGARTVKSLALDARQRHEWDVRVARVTKLRFAEGMMANLIQAGVRPLERLAVNGAFAVGVYIALTTNDPVYIGALFAFLMLSQRVTGPLMQMAQLVNQYDEARIAVAVVANLVNQPAEEGRSGHGVRAPLGGNVEFSKVTFTYKGAAAPALKDVAFEVPEGYDVRYRRPLRFGKDHRHAPAAAAAFQLRRLDQDRRCRRARIRRRSPAAQPGRGAAGELPVQRLDQRKHDDAPRAMRRSTR